MSIFDVTILGNNSAIPAHGRHPSAQFLNIHRTYCLIDCGEGTQNRLREIDNAKLFQISHIFITHAHGDHYLGLMGLLNSLGLMRRSKPLHIFAHQCLKSVIDANHKAMGFTSPYPIIFHILPEKGSGLLHENPFFKVHFFQLDHRIACTGFRFTEVIQQKKLNIKKLTELGIPNRDWGAIQKGNDYSKNGQSFSNEELTLTQPRPRSYSYCSDTRYDERILEHIQDSSCAYIETTYTNKEKDLAYDRYHCTAEDAATMAKKAMIQQLLIGHFSSRYKNVRPFKQEARQIFPNTKIAEEGKTFSI